MKKAFAVILSLTLFIGSFAPMSSIVASASENVVLSQVTRDLAEMYKNDGDYKEELASEKTTSVTVENRIIVKCDEETNTYDSVSSTYAYGYRYIQYSDEKDAAEAFKKFEQAGLEPVYDGISTVDDVGYEEVVKTPKLDGMYSSTVVRNEKYEWAYGACDIDETLNYYKYRTGREVVVGVIDSGIQYNIKTLKNRVIRTNADFSGMATDDEMDRFGHGTQVATTVAMCSPSNVKIEGFKVTNNNNIMDSSVLLALSYIKEMNKKPDIINMSFSGTSMDSHIEDVIDELTDMGIVFVSSAGNDGREVKTYPAAYENVIAVAATDKNNNPCTFSNSSNYVDIAAPGYFTSYKATYQSNAPSYVYSQGTSFSAPIVSAAAAIIASEHSSFTPKQIKDSLINGAIPFAEKDCNKKYGKGVVNFSNLVNISRCKDVKASIPSGVYNGNVTAELSCDNTLVNIIYTTDGTLPSPKNGNIYSSPITLTQSTRIIAAAYEKTDSVFHGRFFCADYYIDEPSEFVVDDNGMVKAYLGASKTVTVPEEIGGIKLVGIDENCFRYTDIKEISLPNSVCKIGDFAFYLCNDLKCNLLSEGITDVGSYAFAYSGINSAVFENCKNADESAFEGSDVKTVKLGLIKEIKNAMFKNCSSLKTLCCPNVADCKNNAQNVFENCRSLKTLFLPKARSLYLDIPSNVNLFVSNKLSFDASNNTDFKYTFIAQLEKGISALKELIEKKTTSMSTSVYEFKDTGGFANSKGAQIRVSDYGLRFGFSWKEIEGLEDLSDSVEYGFLLNYGDTDVLDADNAYKKIKAANVSKNADVTDFNLVITKIPQNQRELTLSVRAYVNIDGWYFYSPIVKRSFYGVAGEVVDDEDVEVTVRESVFDIIRNGGTQ